MSDLVCEAFLRRVWGDGEGGDGEAGYVDVPAHVNGHWVPCVLEWPSNGALTRRIRSSVRDGEDLYFSCCKFRERRRDESCAMGTRWLWADLDGANLGDIEAAGLSPTILWRSSPGRHQALWRLERALAPAVQSVLNRMMTTVCGADPGGWDITQVLRIPGTRNFKYPDRPMVEVLDERGPVYDPRRLFRTLKALGGEVVDLRRPAAAHQTSAGTNVPDPHPNSVIVPARAQALLRATVAVEGERSARLWELECLLVEAGFGEEAVFDMVVGTVWNKWKELSDGGERRLRADIHKAVAHVARRERDRRRMESEGGMDQRGRGWDLGVREPDHRGEDVGGQVPSPVVLDMGPFDSYGTLLGRPFGAAKWLIEDVWAAESHGIIGGEPKTSKTTLALAMAVAVASGEPFLGEYEVHRQGGVLIVQEENSEWLIRDRLRKLAGAAGLLGETRRVTTEEGSIVPEVVELIDFPRDLPIWVANNYGFDLGNSDDRWTLERVIAGCRPALVILDPLYLMIAGANPNNLHEISPYLKWLLELKLKYRCAIAVVHHMGKEQFGGGGGSGGGVRRSGQRLAGSHVLHGWVDSAIYMTKLDSGEVRDEIEVRMGVEFRSMGPRPSVDMRIRMGEVGSLEMEVEWTGDTETRAAEAVGELRELVASGGSGGVTLAFLAEMLGLDKRTVRKRLRDDPQYMIASAGGRGRGNSEKWRMR